MDAAEVGAVGPWAVLRCPATPPQPLPKPRSPNLACCCDATEANLWHALPSCGTAPSCPPRLDFHLDSQRLGDLIMRYTDRATEQCEQLFAPILYNSSCVLPMFQFSPYIPWHVGGHC